MSELDRPLLDKMPEAEYAVHYILERCRNDANFRWYMLHSETMRLCLRAEAKRLGQPESVLETHYSKPSRRGDDVPDVVRLRRLTEDLERNVERMEGKVKQFPELYEGEMDRLLKTIVEYRHAQRDYRRSPSPSTEHRVRLAETDLDACVAEYDQSVYI